MPVAPHGRRLDRQPHLAARREAELRGRLGRHVGTTAPAPPQHDEESQATKVAAAVILCPALAAIFVALRIYTRAFLNKKCFAEDYAIMLALVRSPFEMH